MTSTHTTLHYAFVRSPCVLAICLRSLRSLYLHIHRQRLGMISVPQLLLTQNLQGILQSFLDSLRGELQQGFAAKLVDQLGGKPSLDITSILQLSLELHLVIGQRLHSCCQQFVFLLQTFHRTLLLSPFRSAELVPIPLPVVNAFWRH
jgi:hypothetical protein